MSRRRSRLAGALLAIVGLGLTAGPVAIASAQDDGAVLVLRGIDSRQRDAVAFDLIWTGDAGEIDGLELTENGEPVEVESIEPITEEPRAVVFVVDTSAPNDGSGTLVAARESIQEWVDDAPADTRFALVSAGERAVLLQDLTTNAADIERALGNLGPQEVPGGAIWAGMQLGAATLAAQPEYEPNLVMFTGSADPGTIGSEGSGRGNVVTSGATVFAATFTGAGASTGGINKTVEMSGGFHRTVGDAAGVTAAMDEFEQIITEQQYRVVAPSSTAAAQAAAQEEADARAEEEGRVAARVKASPAAFVVNVGGQSADARVVLGGVARGSSALDPATYEPGGGIAVLQGGIGLILTVGVTLAAGILLTYGITSIFVQDDALGDALRPYSEAYAVGGGDDEAGESMATTAIIQRAVAITEQVAESQGYLARAEAALERARLPLRAGEALFFYVSVVVLATLGALVLYRNLVIGLVLGGLAALLPIAFVNFKASQRKKKFMGQLPDTLQLLSGTLRAGYSLMQGVEAVSTEVEEPMGYELRRVVTESRLGRPLEEALDSAAERMDSPDFGWAVMAIRIQREVGGNLSELLLTVADTMVARERLRRDVAALTAEGRVSAIVLGMLPPGLGVVMFVINPDYTGVLFEDTLGLILLGVAGVAMMIGFFWMKKIIDIEI